MDPLSARGPALDGAVLALELECQRQLLDDLCRGLRETREEFAAMCDCLARIGVLSPARLQAQVHRRRFKAMASYHGLGGDFGGLEAVLGIQEVSAVFAPFAGANALEATCAASGGAAASLRQLVRAERRNFACHLFVCGGGEDLDNVLDTVHHLGPSRGLWETLPKMRQGRWGAAAAILDGDLYVTGGGDGLEILRNVEHLYLFGCRAGQAPYSTWRTAAPLITARIDHAAIAHNGSLFVCGGEGADDRMLDSAESHFPAGLEWIQEPSLFEPRGRVAGGVLRGVLYVCGGCDDQERSLSSVERLNPAIGFWNFAPSMLWSRAGAATAASGFRLWACGGKASPEQRLDSAECFDANAGAWEALAAPMSAARGGLAAAACRGRCYVFGGFDGEEHLSSVEFYDHVLASWIPLPPLPQGRSLFCAVATTVFHHPMSRS